MIIIDDVFKHSDEDRLTTDGTQAPAIISDKLVTNKDSISGILALGMLGIAVAIIVLSLWSQKHKRKPMLMQCGPNVKSYHTMCAIPARLHLPQFIAHSKKDINNTSQLKCSDKIIPLIHDNRKILAQKIYLSQQRPSKIVTVSELWKQKSRQSNNYFLINVIPEEEVS